MEIDKQLAVGKKMKCEAEQACITLECEKLTLVKEGELSLESAWQRDCC